LCLSREFGGRRRYHARRVINFDKMIGHKNAQEAQEEEQRDKKYFFVTLVSGTCRMATLNSYP
jgi:hypothetical protein